MYFLVFTSNKRSIRGVCLLAGVRQRLSIIKTLMKSKTNFLAGWLVKYVLVPTLQYSDWLLFMPVSAAKALNSSAGEPTSSSRSVTWRKESRAIALECILTPHLYVRQNWQQRQQQWHGKQGYFPWAFASRYASQLRTRLFFLAFKAGIWHCAMLLNTSNRPLVIHLLYGEYEHFRYMTWCLGGNCTCLLRSQWHWSEKNLYNGKPQGLSYLFFFLTLQLNKIN